MGTEVLRPQDCLIGRIRVSPAVFQHHRGRNFNGNGTSIHRVSSRKAVVRPEQKKRFEKNGKTEPLRSRRSASLDDLRKSHQQQNRLVMGQVTILRRGESLDSKMNGGDHSYHRPVKAATDDLVVCGTDRLGPEPEIVPSQIRIRDLKSVLSPVKSSGVRSDEYAGAAYSMSPSPRALPLPSFFNKKQVSNSEVVDDSATRHLRQLLRLE
ncbi:hypothetical protein U1Q18_030038 [Sarracenia purpurea var. burkii]